MPLPPSLQASLDALPSTMGVYLFKDTQEKIIYIGKATSLRSRVRSYFQASSDDGRPQFAAIVAKTASLDYIVTRSNLEALVLEAAMVKKHSPRFNIRLKDDKKYPFVRITNEPFPRIFLTRDIVDDGSRYLGPYSNARALRSSLNLMHKLFPVRPCSFALPSASVKLCLEYQIHRCEGPCENLVDQKTYSHTVELAVQFLKGKIRNTIADLESEMAKAAEELRFERAGRIRDLIRSLRLMRTRQHVILDQEVDRDVIALARDDALACCLVLEIRDGVVLDKKHHILTNVIGVPDDEVLATFLQQFYLQMTYAPPQIHLPAPAAEMEQLEEWLSGKGSRVAISVPQRGDKVRTLEVAHENAENILVERRLKRERSRDQIPVAVAALQRDLNLPVPPRRIEGIDISNIQGQDKMGSLVCMVDGKPKRSEYRIFKIGSVDGADDFASIKEVVARRFRGLREREEKLPDLLLIDGGKGQLTSACEALQELELSAQPVVGLAKRLEELFLPGQSEAVLLPKTSASLRMLQVLRDEAHRFALNHHRKQRSKRMLKSGLDTVPGIGAKRKAQLLRSFGSVERIKAASVEDIAELPGFSQKLAETVKGAL